MSKMKEWRVARVSIIGNDAVDELAEKLNQMAQGGWDIDGMEVIGGSTVGGEKMLIIASKEKEEPKRSKEDFWLCDDCGAQLPDCTCPPNMG